MWASCRHRGHRGSVRGSRVAGGSWACRLGVRRHTQQDADHATVEFVARSKLAGRAHRLHEISRFVREDGRWLYVDGDVG